jgi:hypothetical protein
MNNLKKIRYDLENLVDHGYALIEKSENQFLEEFIGFMESPMDKKCIIHTDAKEFA